MRLSLSGDLHRYCARGSGVWKYRWMGQKDSKPEGTEEEQTGTGSVEAQVPKMDSKWTRGADLTYPKMHDNSISHIRIPKSLQKLRLGQVKALRFD